MSEDDTEIYDIIINSYTGRQYEMKVSPIDTVQIIKETLDKLWNIPESECILIFNGQELKDQAVLGDIGIQNGSSLLLLLKMAGGPMSMGGRIYSAGLKNLKDAVEKTKKSLGKKYSSGCRVLVLLYKDQDGNHNVMRIFDEKEDAKVVGAENCPKSQEPWSPRVSTNSDAHSSGKDRHSVLESLHEEMRMKLKVSELRKQMQESAERKKLKKMLRELSVNEKLDEKDCTEKVDSLKNKSSTEQLETKLNEEEKISKKYGPSTDSTDSSDFDNKSFSIKEGLKKDEELTNEKSFMEKMENELKKQVMLSVRKEELSDEEEELWNKDVTSADTVDDFDTLNKNLISGSEYSCDGLMKTYCSKRKYFPKMNTTPMMQEENELNCEQFMKFKIQQQALKRENRLCSHRIRIERQAEDEETQKLRGLLQKQRIELGKLTSALKENMKKSWNLLEPDPLDCASSSSDSPPPTSAERSSSLKELYPQVQEIELKDRIQHNEDPHTWSSPLMRSPTLFHSSPSQTNYLEKSFETHCNPFTDFTGEEKSLTSEEGYPKEYNYLNTKDPEDSGDFFSFRHDSNPLSSFMTSYPKEIYPFEADGSSSSLNQWFTSQSCPIVPIENCRELPIGVGNDSFFRPSKSSFSTAYKKGSPRKSEVLVPRVNFPEEPIDVYSRSSHFDNSESISTSMRKNQMDSDPLGPNESYKEESLEIESTAPFHSHNSSFHKELFSRNLKPLVSAKEFLKDCITDYSNFSGPMPFPPLVHRPKEYLIEDPVKLSKNSSAHSDRKATSPFSKELSKTWHPALGKNSPDALFGVSQPESDYDSEEERLVIDVDGDGRDPAEPMTRFEDLEVTKKTKEVRKLPPVVLERNNKCAVCKRRLNIMNRFDCRCGKIYCPQHRCAESHNCDFNYKEEGRKILNKQNPRIECEKIKKI